MFVSSPAPRLHVPYPFSPTFSSNGARFVSSFLVFRLNIVMAEPSTQSRTPSARAFNNARSFGLSQRASCCQPIQRPRGVLFLFPAGDWRWTLAAGEFHSGLLPAGGTGLLQRRSCERLGLKVGTEWTLMSIALFRHRFSVSLLFG